MVAWDLTDSGSLKLFVLRRVTSSSITLNSATGMPGLGFNLPKTLLNLEISGRFSLLLFTTISFSSPLRSRNLFHTLKSLFIS